MKKQDKNYRISSRLGEGLYTCVEFIKLPTKKDMEELFNYYLKNNLYKLRCMLKDGVLYWTSENGEYVSETDSYNINSNEYDLHEEPIIPENFLCQSKCFIPKRMGNYRYRRGEDGEFLSGGDNDADYSQYDLVPNQTLMDNKSKEKNKSMFRVSILLNIFFFLLGIYVGLL